MKIEIPTPTPAASVSHTPHNSTKAQTETEKQALPTLHLYKATAQTGPQPPAQPASQIKCRQTVNISCMNFHIHKFFSIGVRRTAGAQEIPSRVIHGCLRGFVFHLCIRLCTVSFKFF